MWAERHEVGAITYCSVRRQLCEMCGTGMGTRWPHGTNWVLSLLPRGSSHLPCSAPPPLKKEKKGLGHPVSILGLGHLLTWRSDPRERPHPRFLTCPAQLPPQARNRPRRQLSGRMRAASRHRAQPLPARLWKCGSGSLLRSRTGHGGWWRGPAFTGDPGGGALPAAQRAAGARMGGPQMRADPSFS